MMNSAAIRRLADVRLADATDVGRKAASLGELLAAGVRVPDGVVLTAGVGDLTPEDRGSLLRAGAADLGVGPFAVRSSGIAEDGVEHSYAGIYESVLDVPADELLAATDRVLASAQAARVADYKRAGNGHMAVIIQRMVAPSAAGVVLTADPINGDRQTCPVTAVGGIGERLVSGAAFGDEWAVVDGHATPRRQPEQAIDRHQAMLVASEARKIAAARGTPQDIEWAIDADGTLWILQARPMTALPPDVSWEAPAPGAYTRPRAVGAVRSDQALVTGTPASPGRATGTVRVIRGPQQFDELQPGEILVAPLTAPAWTPLFTRAAAVVTDVGSPASHASIIAREYGIPAVVGCGDATARLRTGMRVTVDGGTGNVEPE